MNHILGMLVGLGTNHWHLRSRRLGLRGPILYSVRLILTCCMFTLLGQTRNVGFLINGRRLDGQSRKLLQRRGPDIGRETRSSHNRQPLG